MDAGKGQAQGHDRGPAAGRPRLDCGRAGSGLRYVGRVGSGFSDAELERLSGLLAPRERRESPFNAGEPPPRGALFCEPEIVIEAEFAHWTAAGNLRAARYKGVRDDKPASQVVREDEALSTAAAGHGAPPAPSAGGPLLSGSTGKSAEIHLGERTLRLSNLDKTMYPSTGFTKRQLIEYYAAVAPAMLAHLQGRALTVTRWPDGVEGKSFFQKQAPAHRPEWVRTATISSASKAIDYTVADDLPTLVWLANLAAIELHAPLARTAALECPTVLVFDLDPGAPAGIVECCHVGLLLQGMFENLGLQSYAKTSGSKGLQVYVPLNRTGISFEQTKAFAKAVAELLESAEAELVVSRMTKEHRRGKVLIDWSQNDRRKTTVCVYSLRAAARPTASTPVSWEEVRSALAGGEPAGLSFEAEEVLGRVVRQGDLFAPVLSLVQELPSF